MEFPKFGASKSFRPKKREKFISSGDSTESCSKWAGCALREESYNSYSGCKTPSVVDQNLRSNQGSHPSAFDRQKNWTSRGGCSGGARTPDPGAPWRPTGMQGIGANYSQP